MSFQSPYKFIEPFREEDLGRFFGRTEEMKQLLALLQKTQVVLLYAKPELGKTSFLRAGISPALQEMGYLPIYVPVLRNPLTALQAALQEKLGTSLTVTDSTALDLLLKEIVASVNRPLVILFDGFERFLISSPVPPGQKGDRTQDPALSAASAQAQPSVEGAESEELILADDLRPSDFWRRLTPCLRNSSLAVKFLFSLREEFLAEFYPLQKQIPTLFTYSLRLTKLTPLQAEEALRFPAEQMGIFYPLKTLRPALAFLEKPDGIHPMELQVVGSELAANWKPQQEPGVEVQGSFQSPEALLTRYVEKVLQNLTRDQYPLALEILQELIRSQGSPRLVTPTDLAHRMQEPVPVVRDILKALQAAYLIQSFNQGGMEIYELTRSCLVDIVKPFLRRQEEAVRSKREELYQFCRHHGARQILNKYDLSYLLSGKNPPLKLLPAEKELLEMRDKLREQKRRRRRRRSLRIPFQKAILLLLLVSLSYVGFVLWLGRFFYFEVSPTDNQTIRIMRGRPNWKVGWLPRPEMEGTGYTLQDFEKASTAALLDKEPIRNIGQWKEQLIPKLVPLQKGIAYREMGKTQEAIQALQPLLESPQLHIARRAAVELVRITSDPALLSQAMEVLSRQGGGNALVLLNDLKQGAPSYLQKFIIETQEKLEKDWMVLVPGGEFLMGTLEGNEDEKPPHTVYLEDFYIDKYEVTNAQYQEFVDSMGLKFSPRDWADGRYESGKGNHPVVNVSWYDAKSYCGWAGKRLPTEAQWEKAARSSDERTYPWGNQFDPNLANVKESGKLLTMPVGSYEGGKSPYGVYDMAGNVWEWTSSLKMSYPYNATDGREDPVDKSLRVIRGGSFNYYHGSARVTNRSHFEPQNWDYSIGFRCAKNAM